ncbi:MAG: dynamin family protein [Planctomycetaceae bacterium]
MLRRILPDDAQLALDRERELLGRLRALAVRFEPGGASAARVEEILAHLDEMFMLVVVGEVKAGKSAFINALLRASVCPEGPTPLTDRVHVLGYASEAAETSEGPHVVRRQFPLESLRDMHIVDTPGTNSPVRRHQEITESFLPRADIVFFVTSIDCPLTQTELGLLRDIKERFRKEIACVLAKTDMHPEGDRATVLQYLEDSFQGYLGFRPRLFPVSSRRAREAQASGDAALLEASGLPAVERYVVENLAEAQRIVLKLKSPLGTALDVIAQMEATAASRLAVLEQDFAGWRAIEGQCSFAATSLGERAERHLTPVAIAFENLEARGRHFLRDSFRLKGLRLLADPRRFREVFDRDVVRGAMREVEAKVEETARWLAEETKSLWERALAQFESKVAAAKYADEILAGDGPAFRGTRAETLQGIVEGARTGLAGFSPEGECGRIRDLASKGLARLIGTEVAAAGLGTMVAAFLAPSILWGAGLLLAAGIAVGGFLVLPARRQKAIEGFESGVRAARDAVLASVRAAFAEEAARASCAILDAFTPFRDFYQQRRLGLEAVRGEAQALRREVLTLQAELG